MKVEVLRGKKLTPDKPSKQTSEPQNSPMQQEEPSQGPGLLGRLGYSLGKGFEAPGKAIDALLGLIGEKPITQGSFVEDIAKSQGYSSEQFQPQSLPETYAQKFLGQAPVSAIFGPAALASTAVGSGAATGVEAAGYPEYADIAQLGTELGYGALSGKIPTLGKKQKAAYEAARAEVPAGKKIQSQPLTAAIEKVKENLATETSPKLEKIVEHAVDKIEKNITFAGKGKELLNPNKALDLRRKLYRDMKNIPSEAHEYIKDLTKGLNDFFASYSAENPAFYDKLKKADQITELKHMKSYIQDGIELIPKALGVDKAVKAIRKPTAAEAEKIMRRIWKSPLAREHYFDVVKSVSTPALLVKNLNNLGEALDEENQEFIPQKTESKSTTGPEIEVVRGRRL